MTTSDRMHRQLKKRLRTFATRILEQIAVPPDEPVKLVECDDDCCVVIEVRAADAPHVVTERVPGKFLSHIEQAIWDSLAERPLIGKQIAAKTKDTYDSTFRVILANLHQRGVIVSNENGGYARASCVSSTNDIGV